MNWAKDLLRLLLLFTVAMITIYSYGHGQVVITNHGIITVLKGTTFSVKGDFKQMSDDLNLIDTAAIIDLKGNIFNEGTGTFTDGATGALTIHGDSIYSRNSQMTVGNLNLSLDAAEDTLKLLGAVNIKDQLTFNTGALDLKNDSLLLTNYTNNDIGYYTNGMLINESENKPILATKPDGVVVAIDDFEFTSDELSQAINKGNLGFNCLFGNGGAGGTIMVARDPNPAKTLPNGSIHRVYHFETTNNETGGIVTFSYFDTELGVFAGKEAYLQLFHSIDDGITWSIVPATLDTALNTAISSSVTDMNGLWTLSDCDAPAITLATDDVVCQGGMVTMESSISPVETYTYQWFVDGVPLEGETNSTIEQEIGDQNIIMTLELTTDLGCTVPAYDTLVPIPAPLVTLEESILKCAEVPIAVDAGAIYSSYEWSNENGDVLGSNQSIDLIGEGAYTLTVTDTTTCANSDTITIINHELANLARFTEEINACESSYNLGEYLAMDNPGASFEWMDELGETAMGSNYNVSQDGDYSVEITSENGCITTATTTVTLNTTDFTNLGKDISIACPMVTLDAGFSGASYQWSDGSTEQTLEIKTSGLYWVEIEISPSCIGRDTIQVELLPAIDSAFFLSATESFVNDTLFFIGLVSSPTTSILWDFEDGNTAVDDLFPYNLYAFTGEYDPTLTTVFENGCVSSYSKHIVIIEEEINAGGRIAQDGELFKEVTIYPNPNDGHFNVEVEFFRPSALEIRIMQITPGRVIDDIQLRDENTYFFKEFDYSYMNVGVYQLILQAGGEVKNYRIVVMK